MTIPGCVVIGVVAPLAVTATFLVLVSALARIASWAMGRWRR
jgi:uncharacterized membrane protein